MNNWQQEGWKEAPVPVWNMLNYVALQEGRNGMAVFSEGLREFEVIGEEKKNLCHYVAAWRGLTGQRRSAFKALGGLRELKCQSRTHNYVVCFLVA